MIVNSSKMHNINETKLNEFVMMFINTGMIKNTEQYTNGTSNLIANAIVHGYENTNVFVEVKEKYKNIIFNVRNQSRYIDKAKLSEIFEKYKSVKSSKNNKASTSEMVDYLETLMSNGRFEEFIKIHQSFFYIQIKFSFHNLSPLYI